MRLNFRNQIAQPNAQGFGNSNQRTNTDRFTSTLHLAKINRMQIRLLRQFFLTHSGIFAVFADSFANFFLMGEMGCHAPLGNQQSARNNTRQNLLIVLQSFRKGIKI
jgi:hypothetical protein